MTHPYGTSLPADMGASVCIAGMDFETYSEAGYVWDGAAQRWRGPPNSPSGKKGLTVVGAAVYAEHPTAEVLSFAYDLRDGYGVRTWRPGEPNPQPLFDHLANGGVVGAWNAAFEVWIWTKVCRPRYGWPPLPIRQVRCTMAKSRAAGYPGSLDAAGSAMGINLRKDKDGERLLDKFSVPRNPTKNDPRTRVLPRDDPEDFARLVAYNCRDVEVEMAAAERLPDLSPVEQEVWFLDHEINTRGIAVDREALADCIAIIEQVYARYDAELISLAGCRASETQKLRSWLARNGVGLDSVDAEHVEDTLKTLRDPAGRNALVRNLTNPDYRDAVARRLAATEDPKVRGHLEDRMAGLGGTVERVTERLGRALRALEIRDLTGSASVKKLYAIRNALAADGRLHDLFSIYGARTGRWTGNGPQPTNLPTSGPPSVRCRGCGRHHAKTVRPCPWCGGLESVPVDWGADVAADALEIIATRSLDWVEAFFGDALYTVSGCLRGLFVAADGRDLICSDYSAIEAVGLAELAGEEWRREVFRTHGKIYEMSAAKISGVPFEDFLRHKEATGQHHPLRKTLGKVAELACFSAHTQVLTRRGYLSMVDVTKDDSVWDGRQWVAHSGVILKGRRGVIWLDGVRVTRKHPISTGRSWRAAEELASDASTLCRALEIGSESLPWSTSNTESLLGARNAPGRPARGGYALRRNGGRIKASFSSTSLPFRAGTSRASKLTELTQMEAMNRARFGSFPVRKTRGINAASSYYRRRLTLSSPVYDIAHAGPLNRFTIKTDSGHLIVHNSGYGGWIGAWKAFGAEEHFSGDDEIKDAILGWRAASPAVVALWGGQRNGMLTGLEGMAILAVLNPGQWTRHRDIYFIFHNDALFMRIPSGRFLTYRHPRVKPSARRAGHLELSYMTWNSNPKMGPMGWIRMETYGGRLTENATQATCRELLVYAMLRLNRAGYPTVQHVYDEIAAEVPQGFGSVEEFEKIMSEAPDFASDWPVRAAGGWRCRRYRKD